MSVSRRGRGADRRGAAGQGGAGDSSEKTYRYMDTDGVVRAAVARMAAVRAAVGPDVGIGLDFHGRVKIPVAKQVQAWTLTCGYMDAHTHVLVCSRVSEHASVLACVYFRITLAKLGIAANGVMALKQYRQGTI